MRSSAFYAVLGVGFILIAGVVWWGTHLHSSISPTASSTASALATSTPPLTGLSIYTNGVYGFSIFYPEQSKTETTFDMQYHLPATWRVNALTDATGTPVIAIVTYHTTSDNSFPRYFETEVRVGVSSDPAEVSACGKVGNGETPLPDETINGVIWKAFALEDAGMMQYLKGVSYRTIHDKQCYALEQIETGSSYIDTPNPSDIPQATLDKHYTDLTSVIQSFSFARP